MYGKFFASTYTGSMFGAGVYVFAVWGYVVANTVDGQVELNPRLLSAVLGTTEDEVRVAIEYLCAPDPRSRSKIEDGKRLIREGEFAYRVPTYLTYRGIRNEEDRREYNRIKKAEQRARDKVKSDVNDKVDVKPIVNESQACQPRSAQEEEEEEEEEDTKVKSGGAPLEPEILPPTPDGLHPNEYARRLLEEIQFPVMRANLIAVGAAITCEIKAGKSAPAAYEFVLACTLDDIERGVEINTFYFTDGRYRPGRRNGNGRQTSAARTRSERSIESLTNAIRRNRSASTSSDAGKQ